MLRLDRYLIKEWLRSFLGTVMVMVSLMVIFDMYDGFDDLLGMGASGEAILRYYLLIIPAFLPVIVPLSLLISLMFSLTHLHRSNEIMAMRAAGWSLLRISRWLWVGALMLAGLQFWLAARVAPQAQEAAEAFYTSLQAKAGLNQTGQTVYTLGYENPETGYLWFMNRFNPQTATGYGVSIHQRTAGGEELSRLLAREARFDAEQGYWTFFEGRRVVRDPRLNLPVQSIPFAALERPDLRISPRLLVALDTRPKDLSLFQLADILDHISLTHPSRPAYEVRYQKVLTSPLICLFVVGIALPLAVTGVRTSAMANIFKAAGMFAVFFILTSVSVILGERQIMPVSAAVWLPQVVLMLIAAALFYRAR